MREKALARITIFTGSFVVFLLEPMVANVLTPAFGGTATVWTVTLATFQALLLAGYALAHGLAHPAKAPGAVRAGYLALLAGCGAWLLAVPGVAEGIVGTIRAGLSPIAAVFAAIVALVGVPFVAMSANASFVQSLVARDRGAYNLYATSNLGSFAGLLAYPLLFEPLLNVDVQVRLAGGLVLAYAALLAALAATARRAAPSRRTATGRVLRTLGRTFSSATRCRAPSVRATGRSRRCRRRPSVRSTTSCATRRRVRRPSWTASSGSSTA